MRLASAFSYYWKISAGYRLRPWASPYVRWRLETYFGKRGDVKRAGEFFHLMWQDRARFGEFVDWVVERRAAQRENRG